MKLQKSVLVIVLLFCSLLFASCASSLRQGQAWLDTKSGPTGLDVSGTWMCQEFSMAQLQQSGRDISGTFYAGGLIKGVASGESVYLLVYDADTVHYMAVLKALDQKTIKGEYARAFDILGDWEGRLKQPMNLVRMPLQ